MAKKKTANCYAVRKGRTTGLFHSWAECEKSVKKYGGASYKGFLTTREAQIWLDTGEMVNATKFYGVVQGHTPGVYSSWAKAQEQVSGFHRPQHRSFETIEEATGYVAKERKIDQSEVFVARGHFDQFRGMEAETTGLKFEPVDHKPFLEQFDALASSQNWRQDQQEYRDRKHKAIKEEFDFHYLTALQGIKIGEEKKQEEEEEKALEPEELYRRKMECYRRLCKILGKKEPGSIEEGQKILKSRPPWVNIIDLIDSRRTGKPFKTWDDFTEFKNYTKNTRKWVSLTVAEGHEFLSALLVDFKNPDRIHEPDIERWEKPFESLSEVQSGCISKRSPETRSTINNSRRTRQLRSRLIIIEDGEC